MKITSFFIATLKKFLKQGGMEITKIIIDNKSGYYVENPEAGAKNFSEKISRKEMGGHFEWPNMVALNKAIACFIGDAKKIVNIGSGTGTFEWFVSVDETLKLVASEYDSDCVKWCNDNRQRENITYCSKNMNEIIQNYGTFDLAVSVDVIEHIKDFGGFLRNFSLLADRAIITTPNKTRNQKSLIAAPPQYYQHVREWAPGELYWVLKVFYEEVTLYSMKDPFVPNAEKIGFHSGLSPLIAVCRK